MALTDSAVRAAKPHAKARKLFDGGGLYLELSPAGGEVVALEIPLRWEGKTALPGRLPGGFLS